MAEPRALTALPEDWSSPLAVVAHPDDMEYGASCAVARWTAQGKTVRYLLATRGEAGIDGLPPHQAGPLREQEEWAACAAVGVDELDAVRDAANRWVFTDLIDADGGQLEPWGGVRFTAISGSPQATHAVDITD